MVRLTCLLLALVVGASTAPAQNLLQNPDAEQPIVAGVIPGWTIVSGNWRYRTSSPSPVEGARYFFAGPGSGTPVGTTTELQQDVDVSDYAASIDAGTQSFTFGGYVRALTDEARVVLEYRDAGGAVLATFDSGLWTTDTHWELLRDVRTAPAGTRTLRVRLLTTYLEPTNNSGYFDTFTLVADDATPASAFDTGDEAWRAIGDPVAGSFTWVASGGSPDGYVRLTDANTGVLIAWLAAPAFLGDQSARYGGALTFDRITSTLARSFTVPDDVRLVGAGGVRLTYNLPDGSEPGLAWTPGSVPLTETGWVRDDTDLPATQAEFLAVLSDLERMEIVAEYSSEPETDGLDNVAFVGGGVYAITAPVGGDVLTAGRRYNVRWTGEGVPDRDDTVNVYLQKGDAAPVLVGSGRNTGRLKVTVPADAATGSDYTFRVERAANALVYGVSAPVIVSNEAELYVFSEPDGGETWQRGIPKTVGWLTPPTAPAGTVTVRWYRGSGLLLETFAGEPDDGALDVVVPADLTTGDFYVTLASDADPAFFGRSNVFTIQRFEVTTPEEGATWAAGSSQTVSWTSGANPDGRLRIAMRSRTSAYTAVVSPYGPYADGSRSITVPSDAPAGVYEVQLIHRYTPPGGVEARQFVYSNEITVTNPAAPTIPVRHFVPPVAAEGSTETLLVVTGLADGTEVGAFAPVDGGDWLLLASGMVEGGEAVVAMPSDVIVGADELAFGPSTVLRLRMVEDGIEREVAARAITRGADGASMDAIRLTSGDVVTVDALTSVTGGEASDLAATVIPNPTAGSATVHFTLPAPGAVTVAVYDMLGREVAKVFDGPATAGTNAVPLPPGLPAGVYVARVSGAGGQTVARFTVTR